MGFSTIRIEPTIWLKDLIAELTATSDLKLVDYLGEKIRVYTVGREYAKTPVIWSKSDDGKVFAEYGGMFAEFKL